MCQIILNQRTTCGLLLVVLHNVFQPIIKTVFNYHLLYSFCTSFTQFYTQDIYKE